MRVGVVGPLAPDCFADNVGDALQRMGHVVTQLGAARPRYRSRVANGIAMTACGALPRLDELTQQRIVRGALEASCEVVISLDASLMPDPVRRLRQDGVRIALWFPDHVANMGRQLMLLAPYNALFLKDPQIVNRLQSMLGIRAYYLPEACNPRWHRPHSPPGTDPYLVIAGNMYPSRVKLLERLVAKGIPLKLYGADFPRWLGETSVREAHTRRYIFREEKAKIFRSAAGVLNTLHPAEISGVNARLFEATGCGAAVITEFRPVLPDLFTIGTEVLAFHDFDELVIQADRLLNETGLTALLGDAAARRAHRDHTYELRLTFILEMVA